MNSYDMLRRTVANNSMEDISKHLCVSTAAIKRWLYNKSVPDMYKKDFLRLMGEPPDLSAQTAREKDQFFTSKETALFCWHKTREACESINIDLAHYHFIDPSAGGGAFYNVLPEGRRIAMDVEPMNKSIAKMDFLTWTPSRAGEKFAVVGNPPFGLRGHSALQFINHASEFADIVAFILPPLFNSDGKGVPGKRVRKYKRVATYPLNSDSFYYPDGTPVSVECVFQVWSKINTEYIIKQERKTCKNLVKIFSISDGGKPSSTRNKKMIGKCDAYIPSTCYKDMKLHYDFEKLPNRRGYGLLILNKKNDIMKFLNKVNWREKSFKSTNGAMNMRTSIIENVITDGGFYDE